MDSKTVKNSNAENLGKSALSVRGGGYLPASGALLAAILLGAMPALAADSSIHAAYTSTAPLSSSTLAEGADLRTVNTSSPLTGEAGWGCLPAANEANPRQARWGVHRRKPPPHP